MRIARVWVVAWVCAPALSAASIVGIPDAPSAWSQPAVWLGTANDSFAGGLADSDDFRTAAIRGGWNAGRVESVVDYSILTNRDGPFGDRFRSDELTASLGYRVIDAGTCRDPARFRLSLGGGARVDGDLYGSSIQNADHRLFGYREVHLPYERHRDVDGLGYAHGDLLLTPDWRIPDAWFEPDFDGQWGLRIDGAALATGGGDRREEAGARLELLGREAEGWIGFAWRWSQGVDASATAAVVDAREDGPWVVTGTSAELGRGTWISLDGGLDPATREAMATLGLLIRKDSAKCPDQPPGQLIEEIGYLSGGPVVRLRWHPHWIVERMPSWLSLEPFGDYRFGHVRDGVLQAHPLFAQWTCGYELGTPIGIGRWQLRPYAEGCAGLRREAVLVRTGGGTDEETALDPVVQGGVGASLLWDGSVGVCVTLDRWLPIGGPEDIPGTSVQYQRTGWSTGARLILVEAF